MAENTLKNTGRILLTLLFILICRVVFAVEIETELTPSVISAGESASLKIKITGNSSSAKPVKLPALNGIQITYSGVSRNFQFINGKTWSGSVYTFAIYGEKKGEYRIPPFILEVGGERVSSREVTLTVREGTSRGNGTADGEIRGDVEVSSDKVYAGEPFVIRYYVSGGGEVVRVEGFSEKPHMKGFVAKALEDRGGEGDKTYAGSYCLVPVETGVHETGGGAVEVVTEIAQGFFSMPGRIRVKFPFRKITVIPIPSAGKPESFKGDVGEFRIEAVIPEGNFKAFEEIKVNVKVSGRGNLLTLSGLHIENEDGIKTVIEEKEQALSVRDGSLTGEKNYLVTIIPQSGGIVSPGRIYIDYFNPYKKVFEKTESMPLSFNVQKNPSTGDGGEVELSMQESSWGKSDYFIAGGVVTALGVLVMALVMWERKKLKIIRLEIRDEPSVKNEESEIKKSEEILKNVQESISGEEREKFLSNADRCIGMINPGNLHIDQINNYNIFKEKIYSCRYGGGSISVSEMDELFKWLKKNLK